MNPKDVEITTGTINFDPTSGLAHPDGERRTSPATGLAHEIGHAFGAFYQTAMFLQRASVKDPDYDDLEEYNATIMFEHIVAKYGGEWLRENHSTGDDYTSESPISNKPAPLSEGDDLGQGLEIKF